jgi:hypothetical protein
MTACLIALTIFFLCYFVYHAITALHFMWGRWYDKCTSQRRAKQEAEEERRRQMEPSGLGDYDPEAAQAQPHKGKIMTPRTEKKDIGDGSSRPATGAKDDSSRPQTAASDDAKGSHPDGGSNHGDDDDQPDQEPMPEPAHTD